MNQRVIIVMAIFLVIIVVSTLGYVAFKSTQPSGNTQPIEGKFTVTLEPEQITMELYEKRNITVTVTSTGYEGNITGPGITCSWLGKKLDLSWRIEPKIRSIEVDGELILTLSISFSWRYQNETLQQSGARLWLEFYVNRWQEDEFKVSSNSVLIIVPPE